MKPDQPLQPHDPIEVAPRPPRWGLGDFAVGVVGGYALASLLTTAWFSVTGKEDLDFLGRTLSQIGLWAGMIGTMLVASRRKGTGRLSEDFGFRFRWSDLGIGLLVAVAVQLLVLPGVAFLLRPLLGQPEVSDPVRELLDESQGVAFVGLLLTVVVGAPLFEELFFRGLLLRSLQHRMRNGLAVVASAIVFGLPHISALPVKAVILVVVSISAFGAVLAALAVRTGRLGPSIVGHAFFNLFTLLYLTFTS